MGNPHKGFTGFRRIVRASGHSARGLRDALVSESAFRQEVLLATALTPTAFWLGRGSLEIALLLATVLLVLIVELLNSAVEAAIDRISLDHHELSRRAKDFGSAAVALALLLCAIVWGSVVWERFFP